MGTSSMIAKCNEDGTVTATYCHYDGYLSYNGKLLVEFYNTPEKANAVATAGYISGLKEDLQVSLDESVHTNEAPVQYNSVEDFLSTGREFCSADYLYLFDGDAWFYASTMQSGPCLMEEVEMNLAATEVA
jgi:hypothetical protein